MQSRWGAWAIVIGAALVATSCGSSSDDLLESAVPSSSTATVELPTTGPPPTDPPSTAPGFNNPGVRTRGGGATASAAAGAAGTGAGGASVPAEARAVDTSNPDRVIGTGTPASCAAAAVVEAVAAGGIITFDCGPSPVTISMSATAKVRNDTGPEIVLDGKGLVTLSGGGQRRILYMNTCDEAQVFTTSHCQDQDHPRLTVQNLTFADGDSTGETVEGGGGGAIFVRGGRVKVVNSRFSGNTCDPTGPDLGGAAIRVLSQSRGLPVYISDSTFEAGSCSNGGALSSIGVSWEIYNSVFSGNEAIGYGANPAKAGTPGGGNGGAIYADGDRFTIRVVNSTLEGNHAREGGGAIFFVSNDRTGSLSIEGSRLSGNPSDGFETYPGIFFLGAGEPATPGSSLG